VDRPELMRSLKEIQGKQVRAVVFIPSAPGVAGIVRFASAGDAGIIHLWNVREDKDVKKLEAHELEVPDRKITCLAVSADGSRLLGGADDGSLRLWDLTTEKEIIVLVGHEKSAVNAVALTLDGTRAVSAGKDGTVRFWQLPR
jgi:WD40 repeat protein